MVKDSLVKNKCRNKVPFPEMALYFPKRRPNARKIIRFTETYFGPNAGYAQQYLFHYMRTRVGRTKK